MLRYYSVIAVGTVSVGRIEFCTKKKDNTSRSCHQYFISSVSKVSRIILFILTQVGTTVATSDMEIILLIAIKDLRAICIILDWCKVLYRCNLN